WDPETDYAVWEDDRMYEIFERTRPEGPLSKRQFVAHYLHPDDVEDFDLALQEAMIAGGHFHIVCRIRLKGRSPRWLKIDGQFQSAAPRERRRMVGVVADITASKRLARRAQRLSERLARIQEKERQIIAQELHDSTVQHLVAASLTIMPLKA